MSFQFSLTLYRPLSVYLTLYQLSIGQDKHNLCLELPDKEACDVLTVSHLAQEVETITGVLIGNQKLIYKGQ